MASDLERQESKECGVAEDFTVFIARKARCGVALWRELELRRANDTLPYLRQGFAFLPPPQPTDNSLASFHQPFILRPGLSPWLSLSRLSFGIRLSCEILSQCHHDTVPVLTLTV
jgi:hypothetical protein